MYPISLDYLYAYLSRVFISMISPETCTGIQLIPIMDVLITPGYFTINTDLHQYDYISIFLALCQNYQHPLQQ